MDFQEMITKSPAEIASIPDADILAESYPIEYYEPTAADRETWLALRARLRDLEKPVEPTFARYYEPPADEYEETYN